MFDRRSFLMGIGVGIIVGALLLQLFHLGETSQSRLGDIGRELEQGLMTGEETPPAPSPTAVGQEAPATPAAADVPDAAQPEPTPEDGVEASPETAAQEPPGAGDEAGRVVIRIEPGASLAEAAELLARVGVIADAESLVQQMKAANKQVRAGYFLFPEGLGDIADAMAIITAQPLSPAEAEAYGDLLWREPVE